MFGSDYEQMRQITERRYVSYCVGGQCHIAQMNVFLQNRYVCYGSGINIRKIIIPNSTVLPPAKTKFREGNVFTRVCQSVHGRGMVPLGAWSLGGMV